MDPRRVKRRVIEYCDSPEKCLPAIVRETDMELEICVDNLESAIAAARGGADRLELCQALDVGGLTPSHGLLRVVKDHVDIPVYMLIRPRPGNFVYSAAEVEIMRKDMISGISGNADGFVTGALRKDGFIDRKACNTLIEAAYGRPVTFHRAFDLTSSDQALQDIISLGFKKLLTSGRCKTASEGIPTLKALIDEADSKISIMPGSGISHLNLQTILDATGAKEYHSSGQDPERPPIVEDVVVKGATSFPLTSCDVVKKMKDILILNFQTRP